MSIERQLTQQIRSMTALSLPSLTLEVTRRRPWASALFVGTRFTIVCTVADDNQAFEHWLADLPEMPVALRGHFVADADVGERRAGAATVEFLVIEEA